MNDEIHVVVVDGDTVLVVVHGVVEFVVSGIGIEVNNLQSEVGPCVGSSSTAQGSHYVRLDPGW